ncbi:ORF6N domain-containing protein [Aliarcobacter lanthieri]|uniref:ORF6N domain-containing protein n=1 Tax=Aliarcobacter lanthieri TaxID=1355374 RepID=UPI00047DA695|nr:ORF6N domain-containing protein [Aliarcobacter lanthieri]
MEEVIIAENSIKNKIYNIRELQVMLDRDLAELYGVKAIRLREQVKRNIDRFPSDFMFQLNENEVNFMVSQNAIPSKQHLGGTLPFVFTEQGVSMLATVLKSNIAIQMSIKIIRIFVNIRNFWQNNSSIFSRIETIEKRQISYEMTNDLKVDFILNALEDKNLKPSEGIFYDGQIYDSYKFINDLLKLAQKEVILIDNYIDDTVFTLLSKYPNINFTIYTNNISKQLNLDFEKYKKQYKNISLKTFKNSHDRFLILDKKEIYHLGASLKDLGKKWFAFSKMSLDIDEILDKLI